MRIVTTKRTDGSLIPAVLELPNAGAPQSDVLVLQHHGGPGGTPLMNPLGTISQTLSLAGYGALGLMSRMHQDFSYDMFEKYVDDVAIMLDFAETLGYSRVVLAGHSMGSAVVTRYLATTSDSRVVGMILFAPCRNLPEWVKEGIGEEAYNAMVQSAHAAVRDGRGDEHFIDSHFQMPHPAKPGYWTRHVLTASAWLSWYGPDATVRITENIGSTSVPLLVLSGDNDDFVTKSHLENVALLAESSPTVTTRWYEGGVSHSFEEAIDDVGADVLAWLGSIEFPCNVSTTALFGSPGSIKGSAIRMTPNPASTVACVVLPDPAENPLSGTAIKFARLLARNGLTVTYAINFPGGYMPLLRQSLEDQREAVASWIKQLRDEHFEKVHLLTFGDAMVTAAAETTSFDVHVNVSNSDICSVYEARVASERYSSFTPVAEPNQVTLLDPPSIGRSADRERTPIPAASDRITVDSQAIEQSRLYATSITPSISDGSQTLEASASKILTLFGG